MNENGYIKGKPANYLIDILEILSGKKKIDKDDITESGIFRDKWLRSNK